MWLGGERVKSVFLAGRLKYSRVIGVRWRTQMDLETLLPDDAGDRQGLAWVFDNMNTVTLGRDASGASRLTPATLARGEGSSPDPPHVLLAASVGREFADDVGGQNRGTPPP